MFSQFRRIQQPQTQVQAAPVQEVKQTIIKPEEIQIIKPQTPKIEVNPDFDEKSIYSFQNSLSWEVVEKPVFDERGQTIKNYKTLVRSDNFKHLSIVTDKYTVTPNQFFLSFVFQLAKATGWKVERFGEVQEGRKILAFLKQENNNLAGFKADKYLLIGNSHDSSSAFFIGSTSILARCENQFTQRHQKIKFFHSANQQNALQMFDFNTFLSIEQRHEEQLKQMQNKALAPADKDNFIKHTLNIEDLSKSRNAEMLSASIERETSDLGKNVFGLLQGATYYTTHEKKQNKKVFGNVFGGAAQTNARAFEFCENLINN